MRQRAGYTLIEVLIVVTLIGVIAAIVAPYLLGRLQAAKRVQAIADLRTIEADVEAFQAEFADAPDDLSAIRRDQFFDPWGTPYRYFAFKGPGWKGGARKDRFLVPLNSTYDLYSEGPDRDTRLPLTPPPSWDDIIRANNGDYLGLASEY